MSWQLAIILSTIGLSFGSVFTKMFLSKHTVNPVVFSIFQQLITAFFIFLLAIYNGAFTISNFKAIPINILLTMVLYGLANIFIYKSIANLSMAKFTVIFSTRVLFTLLLSTLLFGESVSISLLVGIFLVLLSVYLVSIEKKSLVTTHRRKYLLYCGLSALFVGFSAVNDGFILKSVNVYLYTFLSYFLPGLFVLAFYLNQVKTSLKSTLFNMEYIKNTSIVAIFTAISGYLYVLAINLSKSPSKVSGIGVSSVIIVVLLSFIILKERDNYKSKLFASLLCFVGLYLIS